MSTEQRPRPRLPGFKGPFYPRELAKLQQRYQDPRASINREVFAQVAMALGAIPGGVPFNPKTSDGRTWPFAHCFPCGKGGRIALLFPPVDDLKSPWARRIAVYTSYRVTPEERRVFLNRYRLRLDGAIREADEALPSPPPHSLLKRAVAVGLVVIAFFVLLYVTTPRS